MGNYKVVLFDLDGTLSDPKEGITKSVQYALEKSGIVEPDLDQLTKFIGPPLKDSFPLYYQLSEKDTEAAIGFFRERFTQVGMFENVPYEGMAFMLDALKQAGYILVVATSKPTVYARQILEHFKMDCYFDQIVGSNLDGTRAEKGEVIQYAIQAYPQFCLDDFVMVGDREFDIRGASRCGINSIGVTYGYGSYSELEASHPTCLVESIEQLREALLA